MQASNLTDDALTYVRSLYEYTEVDRRYRSLYAYSSSCDDAVHDIEQFDIVLPHEWL